METITIQITRDGLDLILNGLEYYLLALIDADNDSSAELGKAVHLLLRDLTSQRHTDAPPGESWCVKMRLRLPSR
jgi:hypothetical protein